MTQMIEIGADESRCTLAPKLGGSILSWTVAGQPLLRSASDAEIASGKRLGLASFPLVPWSNRIGGGRFAWGGRDIAITPNFAPEPHAIHGIGWNEAWAVEAQSRSSATLTLEHQGDARWPWAFWAQQSVSVEAGRLTIAMSARNLSSESAPLAFGHHPYFDREGASLWFKAKRVWMNGEDMLPTESEVPSGRFDFSEEGSLAGRAVDHCFAGWDGAARIAWEGRPLGLSITSDLPAAVVYVPQGGDRFCFEPVPHSNNALNRADADPPMPVIAPGAVFEASLCFTAVPRTADPRA
jgi:aldose 1-epimerase